MGTGPTDQLRLVALAMLLALGGCMAPAEHAPSAAPVADDPPDDLYRDFLDGKFDGAGHPVGATVVEAEDGCGPAAGLPVDGGWLLRPGKHGPALACMADTDRLGRGVHTVNVRAAIEALAPGPALRVEVRGAEGTLLAERDFDGEAFVTTHSFQNLPVRFEVREAGPVHVEVWWAGELPIRLDYVEVFRRDRQLVLSPPSGLVDPVAPFRIEIVDPPDDALPFVTCNGEDRTAALEALVVSGEATIEETEFRRILTVPADALFEGCGPDRAIVVEAGARWSVATSEVRHLAMPPSCDFAPDRVRVLLTGFVPFPAGSMRANSSSVAVTSFDAEAVPDATVMRLVLPVEFDAAASIVRDVIARCRPDVVVGFGQGRYAVDLETTAYNRRDTSEVPGGVPDNRGVVYDGAPIVAGGADELGTRLPLDRILDRLGAQAVAAELSDDPGLYVCNDLFYAILTATSDDVPAGFVHLPRLFDPSEDDVRMLDTVVREVVRAAVEGRRTGA